MKIYIVISALLALFWGAITGAILGSTAALIVAAITFVVCIFGLSICASAAIGNERFERYERE